MGNVKTPDKIVENKKLTNVEPIGIEVSEKIVNGPEPKAAPFTATAPTSSTVVSIAVPKDFDYKGCRVKMIVHPASGSVQANCRCETSDISLTKADATIAAKAMKKNIDFILKKAGKKSC